jgi:hypothetical protein
LRWDVILPEILAIIVLSFCSYPYLKVDSMADCIDITWQYQAYKIRIQRLKKPMKSPEAVNSRSTDATKAERYIATGQRIIYKTLYCCLRATITPVQIWVNSMLL